MFNSSPGSSGIQPQPVNTATPGNSIWRSLDRNSFRRSAVALRQASNGIASDEEIHSASRWQQRHLSSDSTLYRIPFDIEQRLVDDLAFIAASEENLRVGSAVTLEQYVNPSRLVFRLAANEYTPRGVPNTLKSIFEILGRCASRKLSRVDCANAIFDQIVALSRRRIWSRLQPAPREIPIGLSGKTHQHLYKEILKVVGALEQQMIHDIQDFREIIAQLKVLSEHCRLLQNCSRNSNDELLLLGEIVTQSHNISVNGGKSSLESHVVDKRFVFQDARWMCCIRQLDKIGRYRGFCESAAEDSRRYPEMFKHIELHTLNPYKPARSLITGGQAARSHLHVHAEMQILAFYGLKSNAKLPKPRVIGVSRAACYLCNLFVQRHEGFFVTKTHGRLFDAWNFPDLAETDPTQQDIYRETIARMDSNMRNALVRELRNPSRRQNPIGSWPALPLPTISSPVASTILSQVPEEAENGFIETAFPDSHSSLTAKQNTTPPIPTIPPLNAPSEDPDPGIESITQVPPPDSPPPSPFSSNPSPQPSHFSLATIGPARSNHPPAPIPSPIPPSPSPPTTSPRLPPSSLPLLSPTLPTTHTITPTSPFHTRIANISTTFEIEPNAKGTVTIDDTTNHSHSTDNERISATAQPIDVMQMEAGTGLVFERAGGVDGVVLDLKFGGRGRRVELKWVEG